MPEVEAVKDFYNLKSNISPIIVFVIYGIYELFIVPLIEGKLLMKDSPDTLKCGGIIWCCYLSGMMAVCQTHIFLSKLWIIIANIFFETIWGIWLLPYMGINFAECITSEQTEKFRLN